MLKNSFDLRISGRHEFRNIPLTAGFSLVGKDGGQCIPLREGLPVSLQTAQVTHKETPTTHGCFSRERSPGRTSTPVNGRQCVIGVSAIGHMNVTQLPAQKMPVSICRASVPSRVESFLGMNPEFLRTLGG